MFYPCSTQDDSALLIASPLEVDKEEAFIFNMLSSRSLQRRWWPRSSRLVRRSSSLPSIVVRKLLFKQPLHGRFLGDKASKK